MPQPVLCYHSLLKDRSYNFNKSIKCFGWLDVAGSGHLPFYCLCECCLHKWECIFGTPPSSTLSYHNTSGQWAACCIATFAFDVEATRGMSTELQSFLWMLLRTDLGFVLLFFFHLSVAASKVSSLRKLWSMQNLCLRWKWFIQMSKI